MTPSIDSIRMREGETHSEFNRRFAQDFKKRLEVEVVCSVKGCTKNSIIAVQQYPSQSWMYYCKEHNEARLREESI